MKSIHAQRGMSYWGVMFGILFAVFLVKASLATWPVYWDNRLINQVITERLKELDDKTSPEEFKRGVNDQLKMNGIRDLNIDDIAKINTTGALYVETDYEIREPFIANIDIVISFKRKFDQRVIKAGE